MSQAAQSQTYIKLTGTNFDNTRDGFANAFDGDVATFIDASASGNYVGTVLELTKVTKLRFYPRSSSLAGLMTNGKL